MTRQPSLLELAERVRRRLLHGGAEVWAFPTSTDRVVLLAVLDHCRLALVLEAAPSGLALRGSIDVGEGPFTSVASRLIPTGDGSHDGAELAARLIEIARAHGAGRRPGDFPSRG